MNIGDIFKPANGGDLYARIEAFPERTTSTVTGKPLAKPVQDVEFKTRKNNRGRWSTRTHRLPKRSFRLEFAAMALLLAMLPGIAFAQFLGYSQPNGIGGWNYYGAPNAGYDNAMATQNFLGAMRMIQQQRQFNRQMELMQQEMDRRDLELRQQYRYRPQSASASAITDAEPVKIELRNPYGFGTEFE